MIKSESCMVSAPNLPPSAIKIFGKYKSLITSSIPKPADPETWKPLEINQAPFAERGIQDIWRNSDLCRPSNSLAIKKEDQKTKPSLEIEKVYVPKNKNRFLIIAKKR
jgi:hypothetical protein